MSCWNHVLLSLLKPHILLHNKLSQSNFQTPYIFHKFRGSTNGVVINDEIWFMCHYVSYEDRRFYYHCVVRLNKYTLEVVDYSKLFTFSGSPVEYCLGMVHKNNKLVFSYSIMDKTSYIMRIDREVFLKMLF